MVRERLGRGLYRLADLAPLGNLDLVTVALRIPSGVVYLRSLLAFHELTTQIPYEVSSLTKDRRQTALRLPGGP